ncbi:MAG: MarR family winged helix-turn-helix transcriptional regulator [Sphingomonas bacterium]|nr:MarR family winged helix-turn-helix transcriptional regulator [Sphingomonas bacterium]
MNRIARAAYSAKISSDFDLQYSSGKPALLFGSDSHALRRTNEMLTAAGVRVTVQSGLGEAFARLDRQVAVGLVWIECAEVGGLPSDALLGRLADLAESGEAAVVACAPTSMTDLLFARFGQSPAQILIDADDMQRASAVSVVLAEAKRPARVSDVGRDNAVRLRQLSDEMGRIAEKLARLSAIPDEASPSVLRLIDPTKKAPPLSVDSVRTVISARRLRSRFFAEELFADPAWDMLLDLLHAEVAQHRVPISSLCIAAAVPATTALRWIKSMTDSGLFVRRADPHDARRVFVELSPQASAAMRAYFAELAKLAA